MNLRERCKKVWGKLSTDCTMWCKDGDILEAFAREIRNEALEDAANKCREWSRAGECNSWIYERLMSLKDDAGSAKESSDGNV